VQADNSVETADTLHQKRAELRNKSYAAPHFELMRMIVPAGVVDRLVIIFTDQRLLVLNRTTGIQIPKYVFRQSDTPVSIACRP